jgi:hypothetical protein
MIHLFVGNLHMLIRRRKLPSLHPPHMLPQLLLLWE